MNICDRCAQDVSHCPLYPNACGKIADAQYIIAARDEWWLSRLEQYRCGDIDDLANGYIMIPPDVFEALKREVGQ